MENNPLTLIVREKKLGSLVTNAKEIKAFVEEQLKTYNVDNYTGDAKQAAKDKAELNNAAKRLNDERIYLEKEWNMPFLEFKNIVKETTDLINSASAKLDLIVKEQEAKEKAEKQAEIEKLWAAKNFSLVELGRVFNPKWLNKTTKLTSVDVEMDDIIKRINGDLASLDAFGEDTATLKDIYLSTLNLQMTLNKGAELKANRERLAAMEAQKKAEAEKAQNAETSVDEPEQAEPEETKEEVSESEETKPVEDNSVPKMPVYKFNLSGDENEIALVKEIAAGIGLNIVPSVTMTGNGNQIAIFKKLLNDNGYAYDKQGIINLAVRKID